MTPLAWKPINYAAINAYCLPRLETLVREWLPSGYRRGDEWCALNPTRDDHRIGSFSVNIRTGKWADFATGDQGGDPISLHAYLTGLRQAQAAKSLAARMGIA